MTPSGSTTVTINRLAPGTLYEFQVIGKNALGDGMLSKVITVRTLGNDHLPTLSPIERAVKSKDSKLHRFVRNARNPLFRGDRFPNSKHCTCI